MALKVEVSKLFQCGISSGQSNHFCRDVPKCKRVFEVLEKYFLEASGASLLTAAKASELFPICAFILSEG